MSARKRKAIMALLMLCFIIVAAVLTVPSLIPQGAADAQQCQCECDWWCCE
jgi:hypothetical protein